LLAPSAVVLLVAEHDYPEKLKKIVRPPIQGHSFYQESYTRSNAPNRPPRRIAKTRVSTKKQTFLTTEIAESTEEKDYILGLLCVLCGEIFLSCDECAPQMLTLQFA